jgi:hypothetical protein
VVQVATFLLCALLLAMALYAIGVRDQRAAYQTWSELRSMLWRRKAWWLGPIAIMVSLILILMIGTTQSGCAPRIYEALSN